MNLMLFVLFEAFRKPGEENDYTSDRKDYINLQVGLALFSVECGNFFPWFVVELPV